MSLQERLAASLKSVEESNDFILLDQTGFLLAHFERAGFPIKETHIKDKGLPKLLDHVNDCLGDVVNISKTQAFLAAIDYENKDGDLGEVATCLIKIYK